MAASPTFPSWVARIRAAETGTAGLQDFNPKATCPDPRHPCRSTCLTGISKAATRSDGYV
jgi:hypothetical protein